MFSLARVSASSLAPSRGDYIMITLSHIADTHHGHRQYGLKQREDDMISSTRVALQEMVEEHDTDAILLPGDLFHSRDLRPKVLHQTERELERVPDDVPVLVSRGNHDENLTPRDVTWLNYLHQRGRIVFLNADLDTNTDAARFEPYDPENPGQSAGFYDIDVDRFDGPVRVFGLQWRGARTGTAMEKVASGIRATNERHGEPAFTVLLGHFGMEDEVPTLGGTVTHADLREVNELVDYLALGHIHKPYESEGWIFNPGSPEAHSTREGAEDWEHGYYTVELGQPDSRDELDGERTVVDVSHHPTKRRPYYRIEFDVTAFDSPGELETAFREHVYDQLDDIEEYCADQRYTAQGEPRAPVVDLRFRGTLQFSRGEFRPDELAAYVESACNALYVQVNTGVRTADVEDLISEVGGNVFNDDGTLNRAALEDEVFETIAEESVYAAQAEAVADVLGEAHRMAQADEAPEDIGETVSEKRRELFPERGDDVRLDIDENPFEELSDEELAALVDGEPPEAVAEAEEVVGR